MNTWNQQFRKYTKMLESREALNILTNKAKNSIKNQNQKDFLKSSSIFSSQQIMQKKTRKSQEKDTKQSLMNFTSSKLQDYRQIVITNAPSEQIYKFLINLYKGTLYSLKSLKPPTQNHVKTNTVKLSEPIISFKKFLVLDLDETLIHTTRQQCGSKYLYDLRFRPYVVEFLEQLSKYYNIYVFTAAHRSYAKAVVKKLNASKILINDILSRENCFQTKKGKFIKDLRIISNRDLKDIVMIDNLVESFGLQIDNGIPILDFRGNQEDIELKELVSYLKFLSEVDDVRIQLKRRFNLRGLMRFQKKTIHHVLK